MLEGILAAASLYLPGHLLGGWLARKDDGAAEVVLLRVSAALALAVPLLTLAAVTGLFTVPVIVVSGLVCALGVWGFLRLRGVGSGTANRWDLAYLLLVACAFALYSLPAEYVINSRDPGVYTVIADRLARTGELFYRDPLVEAVSSFHPFLEGRKYPGFFILDGSLVAGQFFPGPFALLGLGNLAGGVWGSLYVVPVMGALSVAVAFALGKELFGRWAGLVGAAFLATSYTQIWWSRHPSSEVMAQLLILSGLWLAVRFARRSEPLMGVFCGLLLGGAMLLRVDAFLAAAAMPLVFAYDLFVRRRWREAMRWLYPGVPLALFAAAALAYLDTFGARYLHVIYAEHGLRGFLNVLPFIVAATALLVVAFFFVHRWWGVRVGEYLAARGGRVALVAALAVAAIALWAYFILPVPWETLPAASRDFDAYRTQTLVRLVWFTTPAVAALGLCGFLIAARKMESALAIVLGAFLAFGVLYVAVPDVAPDLPWATRRFVPAAFPLLCMLAGYAAVEAGRFLGRAWRPVAGVALSVSLVALALGWTVYVVLPIVPFRELEGAVSQFERVNAEIPPTGVVFMEMPDGYDIGASTFEYVYGRPVLPYDRLRFIKEKDRLREAGLLEDAVYITTDGGPAPLISNVDFREVGRGVIKAPRLRPAETKVPDEKEYLEVRYRIFRVADESDDRRQ